MVLLLSSWHYIGDLQSTLILSEIWLGASVLFPFSGARWSAASSPAEHISTISDFPKFLIVLIYKTEVIKGFQSLGCYKY